MPTFAYQAVDRQGKTVQGSVDAASAGEAAVALNKQGLMVSRLSEGGLAKAAPTAPTRVAPATPPVAARPVSGRPVAAPAVRQESRPVAALTQPEEPILTRRGSDKDVFVVMSQLARYLRTGVNPRSALEELAKGSIPAAYRAALLDAAQSAGAGGSVGEALRRYPDLFPSYVSGMLIAGEQGGYLPDAAQTASEVAHSAHSLARGLRWYSILFWILICLGWLSLVVAESSLASMDLQQRTNDLGSAVPILLGFLGKKLVAFLPLLLGTLAVMVALRELWRSRRLREFRHRGALKAPFLGRRAVAESVQHFAASMGRLSQAGIPPATAFELASETAPNRVIASELREAVSGANLGTKASELFAKLRRLPPEYKDIVSNGELTGDMPGALGSVAQAMDGEFADHDLRSRRFAQVVVIPLLGIVVLVILAHVSRTFYSGWIEVMTRPEP